MGIEQEGSIAFTLRHADRDWATNDKPYRFNTAEMGTVRAWAIKKPDQTVEFHLSGPLKSEIVLDGKLPPVGEQGLHVVITWSEKEVRLYLDARPHRVMQVPKARPGQTPDA